jgi:hypothetical protein
MGLASIANVPSDDPESLSKWAFSHMQHHRDIIQRIKNIYGISLPEYTLDPIDPDNPLIFDQHQIMHNGMNSVLGIAGDDLSVVNWGNSGERTVWIYLNMIEHLQVNTLLGV